MRGRHLTCARRKERNDGIAIVTKSIASCVPARRALPQAEGETREEGGHALEMLALGIL